MNILRTSLLTVAVFAGVNLFCDDNSDRPQRHERRWGEQGERGEWGRRGERGGRWNTQNLRFEAEQKLKEKFPAEFAEIQKLRDEAEKKLQELAQKANIELPAAPKSMQERMAELKAKYPAEFAEMDKLRESDPAAAFAKMRELLEKEGITRHRDGAVPAKPAPERQNTGKILQELRKKYPEEMKAIQELRKKDPKKAREKTQELLKKLEKESAK